MADGGRAGSKQNSGSEAKRAGSTAPKRLDRLGQWLGGGGSLRQLDAAGAGNPTSADQASANAGDDPGRASDGERPSELGLGVDDQSPGTASAWWGPVEEGDNRPGERVPVYRMHGTTREPGGALLFTRHDLHSEAGYARGECVLGQGSLWQEAAALAYLSAPPRFYGQRHKLDVRPALLLLMHAGDCSQAERVISYAARYLQAHSARSGLHPTAQTLQTAASDAVGELFRLRDGRTNAYQRGLRGMSATAPLAAPSCATRARELKVRNSTFAGLRSTALTALSRRLREAESRFSAVANYTAPRSSDPGDRGHAADWQWKPEPRGKAYRTVRRSPGNA